MNELEVVFYEYHLPKDCRGCQYLHYRYIKQLEKYGYTCEKPGERKMVVTKGFPCPGENKANGVKYTD